MSHTAFLQRTKQQMYSQLMHIFSCILLQITSSIYTYNPDYIQSVAWNSRFSLSYHIQEVFRTVIFALFSSRWWNLSSRYLSLQIHLCNLFYKIQLSSTHAYHKHSENFSVWSFADWQDWSVSNRSWSKMDVWQQPRKTYKIEPDVLWHCSPLCTKYHIVLTRMERWWYTGHDTSRRKKLGRFSTSVWDESNLLCKY